jgi:hypothetical protein
MEASHDRDPARHQVYLLTLWRETPDAPWRAALRPAGSQARIGFADLRALAQFLVRLNDSGAHLATEITQSIEATADAAERTIE